ncbi:transcriptional regulator [Clostridia bacterium]|nr:transcriptional regulator [Clostridia bacterium]
MGGQKQHTRLLPYPVIEAAASGDVDAINKVLKHYEGYIIALSTRRFYDEDGTPRLCVDNEMRRTLETKLIVKILQFDLTRAA